MLGGSPPSVAYRLRLSAANTTDIAGHLCGGMEAAILWDAWAACVRVPTSLYDRGLIAHKHAAGPE